MGESKTIRYDVLYRKVHDIALDAYHKVYGVTETKVFPDKAVLFCQHISKDLMEYFSELSGKKGGSE